MENNNIKKFLLRDRPKAYFEFIRKGNAYYYAEILDPETEIVWRITFEIPVVDMGEADFKLEMPGNLLMRWIYSSTKVNYPI